MRVFRCMSTVLVLALFASLLFYVNAQTPDRSVQCLACKAAIDALQIKWGNATTVEEILADLEQKCASKAKPDLCDKVVETLVKIPPGIFQGIASLAWPVSLGLCATFDQCTTPCCSKDNVPEQVHLSLGSSTDRSMMAVSWVTLTGTASVVRYGTSKDNLDMTVEGTVLTMTQGGWIGVVHRAIMTNLLPGTTYWYQVGDGTVFSSSSFDFTTFAPNKPITFAVIADMAYDENSDNTVASLTKLVEEKKIDVVIHSGDISYADGFMPHFDVFMNKIQPIAAHVIYQVVPGNHEFGYNFTAYKTRFYMPIDLGGSGDGMFYSWEYGNVHFAALNSESPIDTPAFTDNEKSWASNDLANVDRAKTPWSLAHFHRPLYCARDASCGEVLIKRGLEDLLYENKVDMVLVGHVHSYERTYPVYKNEKQQANAAPTYLMQGASGNREGNDGPYPPLDQLPAWVASAHNDIGYGLLTQSADGSRLDWKFFNSASNELLDSLTISK